MYYQKAIAADSKNPNWYIKFAKVYFVLQLSHIALSDFSTASQDAQQVILNLKKATAIEPGIARAYFFLGFTYTLTKDFDKARKNLQKARELFYKKNDSIRGGYVDKFLKNVLTIAHDEDVLKKDSGNTEVLLELGSKYALINPQDAVNLLERYLKAVPDNITAYNNLAIAYERMLKFKESAGCLQKIIQMDPNNSSAYYALGKIYIILQRLDEAKIYLQKARALKEKGAVQE